jgi:high affinity Mn2+ porin
MGMNLGSLAGHERRPVTRLILFLIVLTLASAQSAQAQQPVFKAPVANAYPYFDWSGFYLGGHVGYARGNARVTLNDPNPPPSPDAGSGDNSVTLAPAGLMNWRSPFGSLTGGVQLGYNYVLPSRMLIGFEADASFLNYLSGDDLAWTRLSTSAEFAEKVDYMGTARVRLGQTVGHWLVYATGGFAWSLGRYLANPGVTDDTDKLLHLHKGWAAGAGLETAIAREWILRLEYLYRNFGEAGVLFPSGVLAQSAYDVHSLRLGLNYKPDWSGANTSAGRNSTWAQLPEWEVHGQTTYIQQGYPAFRSPYLGPNSFTPWAQTRETWTGSAFLAVRLWNGGELYYNPELLQGFGLHDTTGAAGFPNGEAQKSNFAYARLSTSRLFFRETVGLGGEQETVESSYGQMAGKRDVSRLTFQVGRFAVHDVFDTNAYATDSRSDFMNWSIWAAGAFDYPGDKLGLGYGAVTELNQKYWAVRLGYFLTGNEPNSNEFDMQLFKRGAYIAELELRPTLFARTGKIRAAVWADTYFSGSYSEALNLTLLYPGLDPTDAIVQTRTGRTKYGYYFNIEQPVTDNVGVFGRWSWNNGKNEITAFTDIDYSLSLGTSIKGGAWGRTDDKIGIAGAMNGLSRDHRDYLAAGGLGILIGDSRLNYRPERILETFYALNLAKGWTLTFDYQFMVNPADNADRGPISFFSGRLHGEF